MYTQSYTAQPAWLYGDLWQKTLPDGFSDTGDLAGYLGTAKEGMPDGFSDAGDLGNYLGDYLGQGFESNPDPSTLAPYISAPGLPSTLPSTIIDILNDAQRAINDAKGAAAGAAAADVAQTQGATIAVGGGTLLLLAAVGAFLLSRRRSR